jgi:hypothetical protein
MDAMTWWAEYGTDHCKKIVEAADTSWAYFVHVAHKRKRFGPDLARKMVRLSGDKLSFDKLMFPKSELIASAKKL